MHILRNTSGGLAWLIAPSLAAIAQLFSLFALFSEAPARRPASAAPDCLARGIAFRLRSARNVLNLGAASCAANRDGDRRA